MPKKTVEQIIDSGNHYLIQVKRNQPTLFNQIQEVMLTQIPLDQAVLEDIGHGRRTFWHISVYNALPTPKSDEWKGLKRFIHIHRVCYDTKKKVTTHSDRLYITDLATTSAPLYVKGIREHWKIENSLHWVKDVIHGEDSNAIQMGQGPMNHSIISSIAINLHRSMGEWSITEGQVKVAANIRDIICKIST